MTNQTLRRLALLLKDRVTTVHAAITPAFNEVSTWTLNASDAKLPSIGAAKAVLAAFDALTKPPLALYDELRELKREAADAVTLPDDLAVPTVAWDHVTSKPATFPSDWNTMANKPNISGGGGGGSLPYMRMWQGNSDFSKRIDLPETFTPAAMIIFEYAYGFRAFWTSDWNTEIGYNDGSIGDIAVSAGTVTLPPATLCNTTGKYYSAIIFEGTS